MFKDFKEDPILMHSWAIILAFCFIILLSLCVYESTRPELTEQDYYNKFCTKHFDVSCDNINLK